MGLKKLVTQAKERDLLHGATPRQCNMQHLAFRHATTHATSYETLTPQTNKYAESYATNHATLNATMPENLCNKAAHPASDFVAPIPREIDEIRMWISLLNTELGISLNTLLEQEFISYDDMIDLLNGKQTALPSEVADLIKNSPSWFDYQSNPITKH